MRSKSNQHIRNLADDLDQGEDESDEGVLARARKQYLLETRESVVRNLDLAQLPHQRVYIVDKEMMVQAVKGKLLRNVFDEWELLRDLLTEARKRRVTK